MNGRNGGNSPGSGRLQARGDAVGLTGEQLRERINDCRIRILEELGIEVPAILREGEGDGRS